MNEYELMYVLHPRLTAEEIDAAIERISALVTDPGGEILSVDRWGRRRLAYPIEKNLEGFYVLSTFKAPGTATGPLEAQLNLATDVLRHLIIRGIIPYDEPPRDERVPVERERSARPPRDDDRPRRDDAQGDAAPAAEGDAAPAAEGDAAPAAEGDAAAPVAEAPAAPTAEAPVAEAPASPAVAAPVAEAPAVPTVAAPVVEAPAAPSE